MSKYFQAALSPIQDTYVNKYFQLPLGEITDLATKKQQRSDLTYAQMSKAIQDAYGLKAHKELVADVEYTKGFKRDLDAISGEMMGVEDWTDPKVRNLYDSRIRKVITDPRALTVATNYEYMTKELERQNKLSDDFKSADHRYLQFRDNLGLHNKLYNTADKVGQFTGSYQPYYDYRKEMQESMKHLKAEKTSDPKIGSMWVYVLNNEKLTEDEVVRRSIGSLSPKAIEEMQVEWQYSQARQEGKSFEQYAEDKVRGQARLFTVNNQDIEGFTANRYTADKKQAEYEASLRKDDYSYYNTVTGSYEESGDSTLKIALQQVSEVDMQIAKINEDLADPSIPQDVKNQLRKEKDSLLKETELSRQLIDKKLKEAKANGTYDKSVEVAWNVFKGVQDGGFFNTGSGIAAQHLLGSEAYAQMLSVAKHGITLPDGRKVKIKNKEDFEKYYYPQLSTHKTLGVFSDEDLKETKTVVTTAQVSSDPKAESNQRVSSFLPVIKSGPNNFSAADGTGTLGEHMQQSDIDNLTKDDVIANQDGTFTIKGKVYRLSNPQAFSQSNQAESSTVSRVQSNKNLSVEAKDIGVASQAVADMESLYGSEWKKLETAAKGATSKPTPPASIAGVNISVKNVFPGKYSDIYNVYLYVDGKPVLLTNEKGKPMSFTNFQDIKEYIGKEYNNATNPTHQMTKKNK